MAQERPAKIDKRYQERLSTQRYESAPKIDGVAFVDLRRVVEDGGEFMELGRLTEAAEHSGLKGFQVRQVNYSSLQPGTVKAWHVHKTQEDLWFVPPQFRLLVGLLDCRDGSPTSGQHMRFVMGDGRAQLLHIPRGVAHGVANPWPFVASMVYLVNQQFSVDEADEHRLPWDLLGKEFWHAEPG